MIARIIVSALLIIISYSNLLGAQRNAFCFTCDFMEKYHDSAWQVVDSRNFVAPLAENFQFSMGNFAYRLRADTIDARAVRLESQVNCFGVTPRNYFDDKVVLKGASVFFDSALVRGQSYYRIRLTFDSLGHQAKGCDYKLSDSSFVFDPSAMYDFYYIKNSLGDYRWNQIRDGFEFDYKRIASTYDLNEQAKINFFISPCELTDIGWDRRWENAIDLARNNVVAHFSQDVNRLQMEVVLMLRLLRSWGYAPALWLEGLATAPDFCDLFARENLRNHKLPTLATLGVTGKLRAVERVASSTAAGSFVNFLLKTRSFGKFREVYQQSTDLTTQQVFERVYGESLGTVENQWHQYLDTVSITKTAYNWHIDRSQSFLHVDEMTLYAREGLAATNDTGFFGLVLANLEFTAGDYVGAEKLFRYLAAHDTSKTLTTKVYLANMLTAEGQIAAAESLYQRIVLVDTANSYLYQKLSQIDFSRGRFKEALELIQKAAKKNQTATNAIDIDIALGEALLATGNADSAKARFQLALDRSKIMLSSAGENSLHYLRAGRAALRLGSAKAALDYLDMAFFLEERMFYLGQTFLAMGQAHDLLGQRKAAIEDYRKVLKYPTAYFERQEAEKLLQSAYHN